MAVSLIKNYVPSSLRIYKKTDAYWRSRESEDEGFHPVDVLELEGKFLFHHIVHSNVVHMGVMISGKCGGTVRLAKRKSLRTVQQFCKIENVCAEGMPFCSVFLTMQRSIVALYTCSVCNNAVYKGIVAQI